MGAIARTPALPAVADEVYTVKMTGLDVQVVGPGGECYTFGGFGDYNVAFTQAEVAAACQIMRAAGVTTTTSTLVEAIEYYRSRS